MVEMIKDRTKIAEKSVVEFNQSEQERKQTEHK